MFRMHCSHCHTDRLMNLDNVLSMHRSAEGTVAYVRCHCGKTNIHVFARPESRPMAWERPAKPARRAAS